MAVVVYGLCALTALTCAYLLLRAYARGNFRLLLWSGVCFAGLAATNILLGLDKLVFTTVDLSVWRSAISLASMLVLLYSLIWDVR
jgi:uncharacterized protein DUF5985